MKKKISDENKQKFKKLVDNDNHISAYAVHEVLDENDSDHQLDDFATVIAKARAAHQAK